MRAIVRPPGTSFCQGLTAADLGLPDLARALDQHESYVAALRDWGIEVFELPPSDEFPDSTFVEDAAVIVGDSIVWTRPGAESRGGEVALLRGQMPFDMPSYEIVAPGTLDGGDICEMGDRFLIGISARTNEEGARQLSQILNKSGFGSRWVDIRGDEKLLHLKTGLSYLDGTVVCISELAFHFEDPVVVESSESYAANCAGFGNRRVLLPSGAPKLRATLEAKRFDVKEVDMSEFRKMDGGISCLSIRVPDVPRKYT